MCTFRVMLAAALTAVLAVVAQGQGDGGVTCGAVPPQNTACSELCWCGADCGNCGEKKSCSGSFQRCLSWTKTDWFGGVNGYNEEPRMAGMELSGISQAQCVGGDPNPCSGLAATGMSCKGSFCNMVALSMMSIIVDWRYMEYAEPGWISDNKGKKYAWNKKTGGTSADCLEGHLVTRLQCRDKFCDDLRLTCGPPEGEEVLDGGRTTLWKVDTVGEAWESDWFSEEAGGTKECPVGHVMTGLECEKNKQPKGCLNKCGDYCDNKKIRCRPIRPNPEASGIAGASTGIASDKLMANAQAPSVPCNASCIAALYPEEDKANLHGAINGAVSPSSFCAFALAVLSLWL